MNSICKSVIDIFKEHIQVEYAYNNETKWHSIEDLQSEHLPVDYALEFCKYQTQYWRNAIYEYIDCSLVLINGGRECGVWPISLLKKSKDDKWVISSNGQAVLPPYLSIKVGYNTETARKFLRKCIEAIKEIEKKYEINRTCYRNPIMSDGCDNWLQLLMESGAITKTTHYDLYADIKYSEEQLLSSFRRTNKYSILKGESLWRYEIVDRNCSSEHIEETFEKFRKFHIEVAGRETRSKETWDIQRDSVMNTNDFVVILYDDSDKIVAMSLFATTGSFGLYAVAVYDRELFDKPLGHISQWVAIKHMKGLGISWYYIGKRSYKNDLDNPTEKEISISHFKEGFSTHMFVCQILEL